MSSILEIKRKSPPAQRDIGAIYKAVQAYHVRHIPPQDTPGYWEWAISDLQTVASLHDRNPLIVGLLGAVFDELEREYKHMLADQGGSDPSGSAAADRQTAAHERPTN